MAIDAPEAARTISMSALPGFPDLVVDYLYDFPRLASFYAGDFHSGDDLQAAVERAAAMHRHRGEVSQILVDQNRAWQMPEAVIRNAEALAGEGSTAIVTGQQVGLFGGPLFTLYKTITAIRLARELSERTGRTVVPVFWVEGEDHDFKEIASLTVLRRNELETVTYAGPHDDNPGPVGRLTLGADITRVIDDLEELLPPSDFHDELFAALRDAYRPDRTIEDGFVYWWKHLFAEYGLVFMNPDDRRFKQLTLPLFERELRDAGEPARRVTDTSRVLEEAGYHAQVHARPTNLFLLHDERRLPIDLVDDGFVLRGRAERFSSEEMLALLHDEPERFSPNVILRPLMQDIILPTALYVAGPGEISYFAQYRGVYEWADVEMPVIFPRASATLLESKVGKVLERYEMAISDLAQGVEPAFADVVRRLSEHDLEEEFGQVMAAIHQGINDLKPVIDSVDRSLVRSAEAARAGMVKEVERLKERVFRAEKRHHDEVRAQLEKAWINLFPGGRLQERVVSPLYFFNKYGFGLIDRFMETLAPSERDHHVITL